MTNLLVQAVPPEMADPQPMPELSALPRQPLALIVSGHEWSARSLESVLSPHGYGILRAHSGAEALQRMAIADPDLYLIDERLPDVRVPDICRQIRTSPRVPSDAPILVTTSGLWPRQERLDTLRAGAWDILGLPVDAEELLLRLDGYMRAKLQAAPSPLEELVDPATGLYSNRGILRLLETMAAGAYRHARPLACVIFSPESARPTEGAPAPIPEPELDHVAHRLRATSRTSDTIGRLGPDEFVILAPETDPVGAARMVERLAGAAESIEESDAASRLLLRAGYCAVPNFREASLEPVEMIVRASEALRRARAEHLRVASA